MKIAFDTLTILVLFFFTFLCWNESLGEEYYSITLTPTCTYSYETDARNTMLDHECYVHPINTIPNIVGEESGVIDEEITRDILVPDVSLHNYDPNKVWKSLVRSSSIPNEKYDNVAEPSFASNGSLILFTGNHFASRAINTPNWEFINPDFDFKGIEVPSNTTNSTVSGNGIVDLFWADQHVEYDPNNKMYTWIRQGVPLALGGTTNNIDRLGISKDTINWTVYDLVPTRILNDAFIPKAIFDYPETVLSNNFFYFTTSVLDALEGNEYAIIIRCPLIEFNAALDLPTHPARNVQCDLILDREVKAITPVSGATDPMYFGAHITGITSKMKIYTWYERSSSIGKTIINITEWNNINNREICSIDSQNWWCQANTSSRIRSAWLHDNSINFMWNAIGTYDGNTWKPYVDSASFDLNNNMTYERKYYITDNLRQWVFGAATSNNNKIGTTAFYTTDNHNPFLNLAFGIFNSTNNKWELMQVLNSTSSLPVLNEENRSDYNWGDFLTITKHRKTDKIDPFSWEVGGYKLVGRNYNDIEPYFILIK